MPSLEHHDPERVNLWERDERLDEIYRRPGFMLRRSHQIAI